MEQISRVRRPTGPPRGDQARRSLADQALERLDRLAGGRRLRSIRVFGRDQAPRLLEVGVGEVVERPRLRRRAGLRRDEGHLDRRPRPALHHLDRGDLGVVGTRAPTSCGSADALRDQRAGRCADERVGADAAGRPDGDDLARRARAPPRSRRAFRAAVRPVPRRPPPPRAILVERMPMRLSPSSVRDPVISAQTSPRRATPSARTPRRSSRSSPSCSSAVTESRILTRLRSRPATRA